MRVLNLTPNATTEAQHNAGVMSVRGYVEIELHACYNIVSPVTAEDIMSKVSTLVDIAQTQYATHAIIDGPAWLMPPLSIALYAVGIIPLFPMTQNSTHIEFAPYVELKI